MAKGAARNENLTINIGYVDLARLMREAPQSAAAAQELVEEFTPIATAIKESLEKETEEVKQKLADGSMDEGLLPALQARLVAVHQQSWQRYLARFKYRRDEETRKVSVPVFEAISEVAQRGGFDLVLNQGVAYAKDELDITQDVLKTLQSGEA